MDVKAGDKIIMLKNANRRYALTKEGWTGVVVCTYKHKADIKFDAKGKFKGGTFRIEYKYFKITGGMNMNYDAMTVKELRKYVLDNNLDSGERVQKARKEELVSFIRNGVRLPEPGQRGEQGEMFGGQIEGQKEIHGIVKKPQNAKSGDKIGQAILESIGDMITPQIDEEAVIKLIKEHAPRPEIVHRHIHLPEKKEPIKIEEHTHKEFENILKAVRRGHNIWMIGPAGTGKTTLAGQVAKALDLNFSFNSLSEGCTEASIFGRTLPDKSGNWSYQPAPYVSTYENGGLHLFDEIDSGDPNVMTSINASIANSHLSIPFENMIIKKHPDTVIMCAGNTYGNGADMKFV